MSSASSSASDDVWEVMSTARTIRRFTEEPVDDATLTRCLRAATWAPSGANAQAWRFVVLRSAEQRAVVAKAAARLQQGVCVSLVDLVSVRKSNLYAELLAHLGGADPALGPDPPPLYAVGLRGRKPPKRRPLLDAWFYPMAVGEPLPTLPIWLTPDLRVLLPLETSYAETCRILGIG